MYLIQILLPLYDNGGARFPRADFDHVRRELTDLFGGVTAYLRAPAEGAWRERDGELSHDEMVMVEVMVEELDRPWWMAFREEMKRRFRQEDVLIRTIETERL